MSDLLTAVSLVFIIAGPFLLFADRVDLPTVPFLILAGIVAGFFIDEGLTLELARYGIALLVFSFGIGIEVSGFRSVLSDSETAALGQVLVVGSLGIGLGILLGVPTGEAVYLGIAAAFSSTIVGTALLQTEIRRKLVRGRLAESIQLVQDLLAIVVLLVLGAGTLAPDPIATQLGYGLSFLVVAVLINRHFFDIVGRLAGDSSELMIIGVVSLLVVFIAAAELAGVSIVVGAFAAGIAVRHDPAEYLDLFNGLTSIKDFFVAIFFVTVGALVAAPFVEIGWMASVETLGLVFVLVVLTGVIKPAVTTAILIYNGYEARSATLTGLSIDQVSEFALIIAIEALLLGLLSPAVFDAIILAAAVTMITSSLTHQYGEGIYSTLSERGLIRGGHDRIDALSHVSEACSDHVVIVGYGREGKRLAQTCADLETPHVVIENDPALLEAVASECESYVFGDAMERYTWEKANVGDAKLVVSTVHSDPVSDRLLSYNFDADLVLRTNDVGTAIEYLDRGALYVSVSDLLAGEQLVENLRALFEGDLTPDELRAEQQETFREYAGPIRQRDVGRSDGGA